MRSLTVFEYFKKVDRQRKIKLPQKTLNLAFRHSSLRKVAGNLSLELTTMTLHKPECQVQRVSPDGEWTGSRSCET